MCFVAIIFIIVMAVEIARFTLHANEPAAATGAAGHIAVDAQRGSAVGIGLIALIEIRLALLQLCAVIWCCPWIAKCSIVLLIGLIVSDARAADSADDVAVRVRIHNGLAIIIGEPSPLIPVAMGEQFTCRPEISGITALVILRAEGPVRI